MQCRNTNGALNAVTTSMVYHKLCPPGIYLSQFAVKTLCSIFSEIQERIWSLLKVLVIIVRIASFAFARADPGFIFGGGGRLCMCSHGQHECEDRSPCVRPARPRNYFSHCSSGPPVHFTHQTLTISSFGYLL